ncbi:MULTISPECIES: ThuA domain-containing protein [Actinoalloteichus]|uniref:ThuA-like domain-containing protein n=1 Tax=Actinoalloteichus caeruleus DSM 43889 TaxID=1120930 RepID=A0ABT1JBJ6_ACTCY|nr:ThuA domain-containing protein [Actinoalloteichus caeruleus]MCP2329872.1 hypothetical protein [Actinoalloteichus caeruleus DSM 43889]
MREDAVAAAHPTGTATGHDEVRILRATHPDDNVRQPARGAVRVDGGHAVSGPDHRRRALVVRGGWPGHEPRAATDLFLPFLRGNGFDVDTLDSLDVYTDDERMAATDLVVQCWTMGEATEDQVRGLADAVRAGTGLAGWHGGIIDAFRGSIDYQRLTGGQFLWHAPGLTDFEVTVRPDHAHHPVVAGHHRLRLHSEQYWVATDSHNEVLAETVLPAGPDTPWDQPVTMPAIWTRTWGSGRVFVSTLGHHLPDLTDPAVRDITGRGLLWAAR